MQIICHIAVCGYQNKEDRIVGGVDAGENEFPWIAAIVQKGTRSPVCGGSLINDRCHYWIYYHTRSNYEFKK